MEKFIELYKEFGIDCKVYTENNEQIICLAEFGLWSSPEPNVTTSPLFEGYHDFCTRIHFDMEGKFIKQGFWE